MAGRIRRRLGRSVRSTSAWGQRRRAIGIVALASGVLLARPLSAQRVTLAEAIAAAERIAPELAVAAADSAAADAQLSIARLLPNPDLILDYTRSPPQHHFVLEWAIDYPWIRSARIRAARLGVTSAHFTAEAARAGLRYRVEIAYIRATGAAAIEALSRQNVATGAEILRIATIRRDAGDASDLDVALAAVTLDQLRSTALADSLDLLTAWSELQLLTGLPDPRPELEPLSDFPLPLIAEVTEAIPTRIAAAREDLAAEAARLRVAERSRIPALAIRAGFEQGDPTGSEPGILPTFGLTLPLPLFDRGGAAIRVAQANLARATGQLAIAERETEAARLVARRGVELARARLEVDRRMIADAQQVARLSLLAYQEGAFTLVNALDAERSARDAERQLVQDLITGQLAGAAYRLAIGTGGATPPP